MPDQPTPQDRPRVLSGMRPTGRLHLGNYMGALYNWVTLQNELQGPTDPEPGQPKYDCFFFIADWHALTTDYADPSQLKQNVFEIALDFLAAGLDPDRSTIFIQSHVPQHAELHLLLSMITPVSWLERVPTYKDQQEQLREKDLATYGFLGYPLLQSADILLYSPPVTSESTPETRKLFVPVGADQVAHVEITREVARRFNHLYGDRLPFEGVGSPSARASLPSGELDSRNRLLTEPDVILTPSPKLLGTDGRKMSKSYGNTILLTEEDDEVFRKLKSMSTNGQRIRQSDSGDPELCPVGDLHRIFSSPDEDATIRNACRQAVSFCVDCKRAAAESVISHIAPIREKRKLLELDKDQVWRVLGEGSAKARITALALMKTLLPRVFMNYPDPISPNQSNAEAQAQNFTPNLDDPRDLRPFRSFLSDPQLATKQLPHIWRNFVEQKQYLTAEAENVWLTQNKRRLLAAASIRDSDQPTWTFSVRPKSYEVLVLLCWRTTDDRLLDFVLPQKLFVAPWTAAKKAAGKHDMVFTVTREGDAYFLNLPGAPPIDLTGTEAAYKIISD